MNSALTTTVLAALLMAGGIESACAQIQAIPPPAASAGIRVDQPNGGGTDTAIIFGANLGDVLEMAKQAGVKDAAITDTDDKKSKVISGTSNGFPIILWAYECDKGPCEAFAYYAGFGKQDDVDHDFVNSFNDKYVAKLIKYQNGNVLLNLTFKAYGGVTMSHLQDMTTIFVSSIKLAIDFKPS